MDKQEYLSNECIKHLNGVDKEGMMNAVTPLLQRLSSHALETIIAINDAGIELYYLSNKEELLEQLFQIKTIKMSDRVSEGYFTDCDYDRSLDERDVSFLADVSLLLAASYGQGRKEEDYKIAERLYPIDFGCGCHNEYNDCFEYETCSIEDAYGELEGEDVIDGARGLYKEAQGKKFARAKRKRATSCP